METSLTRKDGRHGRTTEVPRRAARASHEDGDRCATGPGHSSRRVPSDREQLGVHPEALRTWVKKAEIDEGLRPGTTSGDAARMAELEREVRELRRANTILRQASAFFAAEPGRPSR